MNPEKRHHLLTDLFNAHGGRLYAALMRLTLRREIAADLLQELFVRLGRSQSFAVARDPPAYAFRTAINLAMEWRRRRTASFPMEALPQAASTAPSPLARMIDAEELERLLDALSTLSDASREIFVLRMIERQSYKEIAVKLGKTAHQVRGLCYAAVRQLREALAHEPFLLPHESGDDHD